jgi:plastocyanin
MNETLFYVFGIALAVSAVVFSFLGLKSQKFPGKALPFVVLWFLVLAAGSTTFAVLHAQEEKEHKAHELEHANEVIEEEQTSEPFEEEEKEHPEGEDEGKDEEVHPSENEGGGGGEKGGSGAALEVVADESALLYEESSLETEAGKVEIDFNNPSAIGHDVKVEKDGAEIGGTDIITQSEDSATVELEPGEYVFFCSVPGHREAGMEGPLTVK